MSGTVTITQQGCATCWVLSLCLLRAVLGSRCHHCHTLGLHQVLGTITITNMGLYQVVGAVIVPYPELYQVPLLSHTWGCMRSQVPPWLHTQRYMRPVSSAVDFQD